MVDPDVESGNGSDVYSALIIEEYARRYVEQKTCMQVTHDISYITTAAATMSTY